eukprot:1371558-Rhodomonas_salina.3
MNGEKLATVERQKSKAIPMQEPAYPQTWKLAARRRLEPRINNPTSSRPVSGFSVPLRNLCQCFSISLSSTPVSALSSPALGHSNSSPFPG